MMVPKWLHTSDLYAAAPEVENGGEKFGLFDIPVCELDTADATTLYIVMGAWCMPWDTVPKSIFLPKWFTMTEGDRQGLLNRYKYFMEELGVLWETAMITRDDVEMYTIMCLRDPPYTGLCIWWEASTLIDNAAVRCLDAYYTVKGKKYLIWDIHLILQYSNGEDVLRVLTKHNIPFNQNKFMQECVYYNHIQCLRYMVECTHGYNNKSLCDYAAYHGRLEIFIYLHQYGFPWSSDSCDFAAGNGHLECLKYAHQHGCPMSQITAKNAAASGNLSCLMYVHQAGGEFDKSTCTIAAARGNFDCLVYAHQNGCKIGKKTCTLAAANGKLDCLVYAHQNGGELGTFDITNDTRGAERYLDCVTYLCENGVKATHYILEDAVWVGNLPCVQYLHKQLNTLTAKEIKSVMSLPVRDYEASIKCIEYLHEQGYPRYPAIDLFFGNDAVSVKTIKYLHEQYPIHTAIDLFFGTDSGDEDGENTPSLS